MKLAIIGQSKICVPAKLCGYDVVHIPSVLKKVSFIKRILRALFFRIHFDNVLNFYDIDIIADKCKDCEIVILHDVMDVEQLCHLMDCIEEKTHESTKLYLYFWNKVRSAHNLCVSERWNILSYDKNDSVKYNFRYVGGFYEYNFISNDLIRDNNSIFFVGVDNGRFNTLRNIEKQLNRADLKTNFIYVNPIKCLFDRRYSAYLPYPKVLEYTKASMAILEVMKPGYSGLTLRTYEALFYRKKLITNNKSIKKYNFYHPSNILIIEENIDVEVLKVFLAKPLSKELMDKSIDYYRYDNWLSRIIKNVKVTDVQE